MLEELKVARIRRRLTQRALGESAGLTENRYWRIENGIAPPPTDDERAALARVLDTSEDALFPGLAQSQPQEQPQG